MSRPMFRHSIVELEKLFSFAKGDIKALQALEDELKHRNVPRALALLDKVQKERSTARPSSNTPEAEPSAPFPEPQEGAQNRAQNQQDALWSEEPKQAPKAVVVTKANRPAMPEAVPTEQPIKSQAPTIRPPKPVEGTPRMSLDEAHKVLKATPGTAWEVIEQTRRQMVQLAHPEKVSKLSPERFAEVQADAKRANAAYAVLIHSRARGNQG